jgi:hypothetical protein
VINSTTFAAAYADESETSASRADDFARGVGDKETNKMITVIEPYNAAEHPKLIEEMFRLRARAFRNGLGWDIQVADGKERDKYDDEAPVYLIYSDDEAREVRESRADRVSVPRNATPKIQRGSERCWGWRQYIQCPYLGGLHGSAWSAKGTRSRVSDGVRAVGRKAKANFSCFGNHRDLES